MPILVPLSQQGAGWRTPGTPLQPRTARLGDIVSGTVDAFGTALYIPTITGWDGSIGTTGEATQREGADGAWLSRANRPARMITVSLKLSGASWESVEKSLDALMAAVPVIEPAVLTIAVGNGVPKQAMVRLSEDILADQKGASATLSIPLVAPDPLRYGITQHQVTMHLPSSSGGLTFPHVFPYSIDATVTSGRETLSNDGNATVYPLLRVSGPATTPTLINATTGQRLTYNAVVDAGRYVDFDMGRRTVLLDGTASRRGAVTGSWWGLGPGDTDVTWTSAAYSSAATLTVAWRDGWL